MSNDLADGIGESDIPTSRLVTTAKGFAIIVVAICPILATKLLEIGVDRVVLHVDIPVGSFKHRSKVFVRQCLKTI